MALRFPIISGSWSNPATWSGSLIPTTVDVVCANGFTVTIDQNISVNQLTTAVTSNPGDHIIMTSNTTPTGYVVAASSTDSPYPAWHAFDNNGSTAWSSSTTVTASPQWISYQFSSSIVINRYALSAGLSAAQSATSWSFQASNDNVNWTTLETKSTTISGIYYSPTLNNTTAYQYYRIYVVTTGTISNRMSTYGILLYASNNTALSGSAGGGFRVTGSHTITCTNSAGIVAGTTTCLTFSGSAGTSTTINSNVYSGVNPAAGIVHSGAGTLTVNGNIYSGVENNTSNFGCLFTGTGTFNVVGNLINQPSNTWTMRTSGAGSTLNIVGNLYCSTNGFGSTLSVAGNSTINITGNLINRMDNGTAWTAYVIVANNPCTINLTGDIFMGLSTTTVLTYGISSNAAITFYMTGNMYSDRFEEGTITQYGGRCVELTGAAYFSHIGAIRAANRASSSPFIPLVSTNTSAINILTGPFISGQYGTAPFQVFRMHLRPTANSYFEFRDNSTNGALPPGATGSRSYLYSPSTVISAPNQNDVRFGTVYASGSQTGQMRVPLPSQVSIGIPVDNTVGTSVLSTNDVVNAIWNSSITELTASNSIGNRLKNVSTPDITANQIIGLI